MKLRNKKTGEIAEVTEVTYFAGKVYVLVNDELKTNLKYTSLAELNKEWEDYEEPEGWWFIDRAYEPHATNSTLRNLDADREIGNYFETKEEAEKAVEKLKAWKRLKDEGFMVIDKKIHGDYVDMTFILNYLVTKDVKKDIDLLFGGEE